MKNWATDLKELKKDKPKFIIWKLEQMINFGLNNEKLSRKELKKYWNKLYIDPLKKRYLKMILWPRRF